MAASACEAISLHKPVLESLRVRGTCVGSGSHVEKIHLRDSARSVSNRRYLQTCRSPFTYFSTRDSPLRNTSFFSDIFWREDDFRTQSAREFHGQSGAAGSSINQEFSIPAVGTESIPTSQRSPDNELSTCKALSATDGCDIEFSAKTDISTARGSSFEIATKGEYDNNSASSLLRDGSTVQGATADLRKPLPDLGSKSRNGCRPQQETELYGVQDEEALHIASFLRGKHILITGATGFLAKVLVETILRVQPDVAQLYLLIQVEQGSESSVAAGKRLDREIIDSELFRILRFQHGDEYECFMHQKLTAVGGNITAPGLGISDAVAGDIALKIDVIVNSAANTTFDERYDVALNINTLGPQRLLEFAKLCLKCPLYLQISTAYVNGKRDGHIPERPFNVGHNLAEELDIMKATEREYFRLLSVVDPNTREGRMYPVLDPHFEVQLAEEQLREAEMNLSRMKESRSVKESMVELGHTRAQMFGWHDTYTLTKAMGEMIIASEREDIPVVIVRPSVVESTLREPFPGWIEGLRMLDPLVMAYGKGQMDAFMLDPETVLDVIPADLVVNVILAAMTKHSGCAQKSPYIYQVASSVLNPLKIRTIVDAAKNHFRMNPMVDNYGSDIQIREISFYTNEQSYLLHMWLKFKLPTLMKMLPWLKGSDVRSDKKDAFILQKTLEKLNHLAKIYKPYIFFKGLFEASNTRSLLKQISTEDQEKFNLGVDVETIDWYNYMNYIHFPGLRCHALKGRGTKSDTIWRI